MPVIAKFQTCPFDEERVPTQFELKDGERQHPENSETPGLASAVSGPRVGLDASASFREVIVASRQNADGRSDREDAIGWEP
jgi:hypothetical protein